ncbi:MAG: hypothetical protein ACI4TB_09820, partial [Lachnospiraceae bacterium]
GGYYYQPYQPEPKNNFYTAAMILGIISLVSLCTFFLPLILGALGILFIILGKRQNKKLNPTAITGLVTSLIGIVSGLVITIFSFASAFTLLQPENRDTLNQQFEEIYGMDFDEYMERIYGEDFEDYLEQFDNMYK